MDFQSHYNYFVPPLSYLITFDYLFIGLDQYRITSDLDGRILHGKPNGGGEMRTLDNNNDFQKWALIAVDQGYQLINVATLIPLTVGNTNLYTYDEQKRIGKSKTSIQS